MRYLSTQSIQRDSLQKLPKINDPFIDQLKGMAILMVVLLHSIPDSILYKTFSFFWLEQAVPLFILIQAYHIKNSFEYKKRGLSYFYSRDTLMKILRRILSPFVLLLSLQLFICYISGNLDWEKVLRDGGIGPGSYYVYVYLEISFLAPLLYYWMRHWSEKAKFFMFVILSEFLELFCSYLMIPDSLYRLLFFRYFFLIYLGFQLNLKENRLTLFKICLAVISIVFIVIDVYTNICCEPFIYGTVWRGFHWIAYFYTVYIFIYLLKLLYNKLLGKILNFLDLMGKYSYEIFLLQMFVFGFDIYKLLGIPFSKFAFILFFPLKIILSMGPLWILKKIRACCILTK